MTDILNKSADTQAEIRSYCLFKYINHKIELDRFTKLINGVIHHIARRHPNYIIWKGMSWRMSRRLMEDIAFDCKDYLSYDHDGDSALLQQVFSHVKHVITEYIEDREVLMLYKPSTEEDIVDYEMVADEKKKSIHLRCLLEPTITEPEAEVIKEEYRPEFDEPKVQAPYTFHNKYPSKKFVENKAHLILEKVLNYNRMEEIVKRQSLNPLAFSQVNTPTKFRSRSHQKRSEPPSSKLQTSIEVANNPFEQIYINLRRNCKGKRADREKQFTQYSIHDIYDNAESEDSYSLDGSFKNSAFTPNDIMKHISNYFNLSFNIQGNQNKEVEKSGNIVTTAASNNQYSDEFMKEFIQFFTNKNMKSLQLKEINKKSILASSTVKIYANQGSVAQLLSSPIPDDEVSIFSEDFEADNFLFDKEDQEKDVCNTGRSPEEMSFENAKAKLNIVKRQYRAAAIKIYEQLNDIYIELTKNTQL